MPANTLLTAAEVAALFRVAESTVYRWARENEVESITVGGTVRFPADQFEHATPGGAA